MAADPPRVPGSLRIELLGGFRVRVGARAIAAAEWRQRKGRGLLKLLALATGHRLHREQVLEVLWPALEPAAASNNLHGAVYAVRHMLEPELTAARLSSYVRAEDDFLVLRAPGGLWVDAEAFEAAARAAQAAPDATAYTDALALYGGDLLPEDRYEDWSFSPREHLRQLFIALLEELAHLHLRQREVGAAIATFERLLGSEPAHESAHLALMRLYARTGHRYQALRQFQRLRVALARELEIAPDPESQRLAEAIRAGTYPTARETLPWSSSPMWQLPSPAPPPASPQLAPAAPPAGAPAEPERTALFATAHTNLSDQTTGFIGRAHELATLARQLADTRLLTLRGGGGCGKTRLAWQVAASQLEHFRDGVWMVELAPLVNPALVAQAVASALHVREVAGQPLTTTLVGALQDRELLLVLDNCEHLCEPVASLARAVLAGCPGVRILATSRRPLSIPGERVWRVPSMTAPDPDALPPMEDLLDYDAIQLFVTRATASWPAFRLTPRNAVAIVHICHRLDGIPLAIELAAGRSHVLNADQIASRLDDAFAVLACGDRSQLPRQQTLRASIAWSVDLLTEPERVLFRRLAVFAGGWTLDAAEAICAGDGLAASAVLDALGGLVEASLVVSEEHAEGMRYHFLEMTRQFALERLRACGEMAEIDRLHAAWYLALAEEAEPFIVDTRQQGWRDRLEHEMDNQRAALSWAQCGGECEIILRLAGALARYWYLSNRLTEGRRWLSAALSLPCDEAFPRPRAKALYQAGVLALFQVDLEQAATHSRASLSIYRALDDWPGIIDALNNLGGVAELGGAFQQASAHYTECAALARSHGDLSRLALAMSNQADVATAEGDFPRATELYEECLELARKASDTRKVAMSLANLGRMALQQGEVARATDLLDEALALAQAGHDSRAIAETLLMLAASAYQVRSYDLAHAQYLEALRSYHQAGNRIGIAQCLEGLARTSYSLGPAEHAVRLLGAAEALRSTMGAPLGPGEHRWYDPLMTALHEDISGRAFAAAWAGGRTTPLEEIVAATLEGAARPAEPVPRARRRSKPRQPGTRAPLSRREREVAAHIATGLTNREIAGQLCIAERTIDTHVSNILSKLNMETREQVTAWWQRHGAEQSTAT